MIPIWKKNHNLKEIKEKIKFSLSSKMINKGKLTYNVEKKILKN